MRLNPKRRLTAYKANVRYARTFTTLYSKVRLKKKKKISKKSPLKRFLNTKQKRKESGKINLLATDFFFKF